MIEIGSFRGRAPAAGCWLAASLVAAGCMSPAPYVPPVRYTAIEARVDEGGLNIRYLSPDGLLYTHAALPDEMRTPRGADAPMTLFLATPHLTGRQPEDDWLTGARVPLLGPAAYRRVRDAALEPIVPRDGSSAVVVPLHDRTISLYYDAEGRFQSRIGDPPEGIEVRERLSLDRYLEPVPAAMEALLDEYGIASRRVLFNTGDVGEDALPFVYVDLDARSAAFMRAGAPAAPTGTSADTFSTTVRTARLFTESHTIGLIDRPVTSVVRLVFMVSDAVRDTFDPAWTLSLDTSPVPPLADGPTMDLAAWEAELDDMFGRPADQGTVSYLVDGEAFFSRLEEMIRSAERSILVRAYIFDNDDYAVRVAELLRERSRDGIHVQVLLDGLGTLAGGVEPAEGTPADHDAPGSIRSFLEEDSDIRVRTLLNPFGTGDHTKCVIVDETVAFVGGMNIGREYRYEWHDLMVEVRGPIVARLGDDFDEVWAEAGFLGDLQKLLLKLAPGRERGPALGYPIRLLYTRAAVSEIRSAQLEAIRRARRYIYLENAYFTDDDFLYELVKARRRGVDVRVVIPMRSDRGVLVRNHVMLANVLFRNGVRVFLSPGMSHMKAAVYDGWACFGSANIDQWSLRLNREADLATSAPEAVDALIEAVFEPDFRASSEMREEFPEHWHDQVWETIGDYVF